MSDLQVVPTVALLEPKKELTRTEADNVRYLMDKHGMREDEALTLVKDDNEWGLFLKDLKKRTDLKNIEIIEKAQEKIKEKIDQGFMEAAQKGSLILAILQDKVYGVPSSQGGPTFQVAGKDIKINVGFPFQPFKKKGKTKDED